MASNVTIVAALTAGTLSFLSPCVLPLVPPYLVYLTGTSIERLADKETEPVVRRETVYAAMLFVAGFSTVFILLGATASTVGMGLRHLQGWLAAKMTELKAVTGLPLPDSVDPLTLIAGLAVIIMGLHFLGVTRIPLPSRPRREGHGRPARAYRHRVPHRLRERRELLAAGDVPGVGTNRLAAAGVRVRCSGRNPG